MTTAEERIAGPAVDKDWTYAELTSYKGKPMVVFRGGDADERFPFQFQRRKAEQLLAAFQKLGVEEVLTMIARVADN